MSLISMPTTPPAPQTVDWTLNDIVAINISSFSGQQQTQDWQAGWLEASVSMPPIQHGDAQAWAAFFMACRGMANTFLFGDPLAVAPRGTGSGTPLVNGSSQSGFSLATKGWTASASGVLLPGDWIQVGQRIYRVLVAASSDGSGHATLSIWPQLREFYMDGDAITLTNTKGVFRLKSNTRKFSITEARFYGFQFEIREAI
jgi:hypothetical protein